MHEDMINSVFNRLKTDSAFRAALKRADNPDTEYQCWEYLADYHVNLEYKERRLPYTTVFASIARSGRECDGKLELGSALCASYDYDRESHPARSKLRRIVACTSVEELCFVLRPILQFIAGKNIGVSYSSLLQDLNWFEKNPEKVLSKWAQQFYGTTEKEEEVNF